MTDSNPGDGSTEGLTPADHLGGIMPSSPPTVPIEGSPGPFDAPATYKRKVGGSEGAAVDDGGDPDEDYAPTHFDALQGSKWTKWLIIGGIAAMIVISAGIALSLGTSSEPLTVAREFMDHLDAGDYREAVKLTDPSCIGGANEAALANIFKGVDIDYSLTRSEVNATGGALIDGTVTIDGLGTQPLNVAMRRVDGDWKVCAVG